MENSRTNLYVGLMSGTSVDSVDAALINFNVHPSELIATHTQSISDSLRQNILTLCNENTDSVDLLGSVDVELGELFAEAVLNLLHKAQIAKHEIRAIGSHGQTIRHRPNAKFPFTIQIGDPHIIASRTEITTVADFRRRDMALGGQAAPLGPAFHEYLFRDFKENYWVLNIGGIANLSFLPADIHQNILGFDTGPGNTLMDAWCMLHIQKQFDDRGLWAASGTINEALLTRLKSDPYFKKTFPKSTGRELFNLDWLNQHFLSLNQPIKPEDVQATLLEFTATTITDAIKTISSSYKKLWVCGGGVNNSQLLKRLTQLCAPQAVSSTSAIGIPPKWIEAAAFAWLAKQTIEGKPGNKPSVTGAKRTSILGAIIPSEKNSPSNDASS